MAATKSASCARGDAVVNFNPKGFSHIFRSNAYTCDETNKFPTGPMVHDVVCTSRNAEAPPTRCTLDLAVVEKSSACQFPNLFL